MKPKTPKDRVLAAFHFEEPDIVPYDVVIEPEVEERLNDHYGGSEWERMVEKHFTIVSFPHYAEMEFVDDVCFRDEYGCVWDAHALPMHLVSSPLSEPSLAGYDFDTVRKTVLDSFHEESAQTIIRDNPDKFILGQCGGGLFERSWMLRGFENALVDSALHPEFYEELLDHLVDLQLATVGKLCELPIDGMFLGDDWGDQRGIILGPERWRRFIKPRFKKLVERVHQAGKVAILHCCGNNFDVIPDMIEAGLDVLESLQPEAMDDYEIKKRYGRNIRLWGGLGTQQVLPFGTPQEVRNEIRRLIAGLGKGGGYVLAPAKPLMREVPTENAIAVLEEFSQKG